MLDSPNLPSQADLNGLYGDWSLSGALQGHANQDLASQFRDQAFQANNNSVAKGTMENQQSALMNPLLVDQQRGANAGRDITNASSGLDLASKQNVYQDKQSLLHKTLAREMSDEDLTNESNTYIQKYQKAILSGNQDEAAKYKNVLDTLVGAATAKAADRVHGRDLAELRSLTDIAVSRNTAESRVNAVEARPVKGNDPYAAFNKLPPATRLGITQMALKGGINPITHEALTPEDRVQLEALVKQDAAVVDQIAAARGQTQGATAAVDPTTGKISIVNKQVPSVAAEPDKKKKPLGAY